MVAPSLKIAILEAVQECQCSAYVACLQGGGRGFAKMLKSHNFLKLYLYIYFMFMVSEFLTICAVICLQYFDQYLNIGQTGLTFTRVNIFLSRKRGREGVKKL